MQVAHFYNTIDQQMIPSQQAMMLDSALAFERLVKNPKTGNYSNKALSCYFTASPFCNLSTCTYRS